MANNNIVVAFQFLCQSQLSSAVCFWLIFLYCYCLVTINFCHSLTLSLIGNPLVAYVCMYAPKGLDVVKLNLNAMPCNNKNRNPWTQLRLAFLTPS